MLRVHRPLNRLVALFTLLSTVLASSEASAMTRSIAKHGTLPGSVPGTAGVPDGTGRATPDSSWFAMGGAWCGDTDLAIYQGCLFRAGNPELACWNGYEWTVVSDQPFYVQKLWVHDGQLFCGGSYDDGLAAWDGQDWDVIGTPDPHNYLGLSLSMTTYQGDLIVGGYFHSIEGIGSTATSWSIARWDGESWHSLGSGLRRPDQFGEFPGRVYDLAVHDGKLVACGNFSIAGGDSAWNVAAWDGVQWTPLGNPQLQLGASAVASFQGQLLLGGRWGNALRTFDGATWSTLEDLYTVETLTVHNGLLYVGGVFHEVGGVATNSIAAWDGQDWFGFGTGVFWDCMESYSGVYAIDFFDDGLVATGNFYLAGEDSVVVAGIARWGPDLRDAATVTMPAIGDWPTTKPVRHDHWPADPAHDAVFLANGSYYLSVVDLRIPGRGFDFELVRTYRSESDFTPETFSQTNTGQIGTGWDFNYNMRLMRGIETSDSCACTELALVDSAYTYFDGAGRKDTYNNPNNVTAAPPGYYEEFEIIGQDSVRIAKKDSTIYQYVDPGFDTFLHLDTITDRNGNEMRFVWEQGTFGAQLEHVEDTLGRNIGFHYDANGRLEYIEDFSGRRVTYEYNDDPALCHLEKVTGPEVASPATGATAGKSVSYVYEENEAPPLLHNLLEVHGNLDDTFLVNEYDDQDRLISQRYGDENQVTTLEYDDSLPGDPDHVLTTVTDPLGNITDWLININMTDAADTNRGHIVRRTEHVALGEGPPQDLVTRWEYNQWGEKVREELPGGNVREWIYDEDAYRDHRKGNLLTERFTSSAREVLETHYTYEDKFNLVETITDPRGNVISNSYDDRGNLILVERPPITQSDGSSQTIQTVYDHNEFGQVVYRQDPEKGTRTYEYYTSGDQEGYLQRVNREGGSFTCDQEVEYDAVGNVTAGTDGNGNRTDYVVNALNQVEKKTAPPVTLAGGATSRYETTYAYDAKNDLVEVVADNTDDEGAVGPSLHTESDYDILGHEIARRESVMGSRMVETLYEYDANQNLARQVLPEGNATRYEYDERNLRTAEIRGDGSSDEAEVRTEYDANGNRVKVLTGDSLQKITEFVFDGFDREVGVIDALGNQTVRTLDENGNVLQVDVVDSSGALLSRTEMAYDEVNRKKWDRVHHFGPGGDIGDGIAQTSHLYDARGSVTRQTDDNGHETAHEYDGLGRRVLTRDALGNETEWTYDCNDNVTLVTEREQGPSGLKTYVTQQDFDELNRLRMVTDNLGFTNEMTYDSRGNVIKEIDALGNRTIHHYDLLNRLTRTDQELRAGGTGDGSITPEPRNSDGLITTQLRYDDNGNITERIQDENATCISPGLGQCSTKFEYDALDRLVRLEYPVLPMFPHGTAREFDYDDDSNVVEVRDQIGSTITRTYDDLNRLTDVVVDHPVGSGINGSTVQHFEYDGLSRVTVAFDNNDPIENDGPDDVTVVQEYDSMSNVIREVTALGTDSLSVRSEYDGVGARISIQYPGGRTLSISRDELNRIDGICEPGVDCSDPNHLPIVGFVYEGPSRIVEQRNGDGSFTTNTFDNDRRLVLRTHSAADSSKLNEVALAYDGKDNVRQRIETEDGPLAKYQRDYYYDSAHRLRASFDSSQNQRLAQDPRAYVYDGVGNRVMTFDNGGSTSYQPDAMNGYYSVDGDLYTYDKKGNLLDDGQRTYGYDAWNRLITVEDGGDVARLRYDTRDRLISVVRGASTKQRIWDGTEVVEERNGDGDVLAEYVYGTGVDHALRTYRNGETYTYHSDRQRSVAAVTDLDGHVVERYRYWAFGETSVYDGGGAPLAESAIGSPIGFQGRWREGGLYYFRARFYDPEAGRFLTRDPEEYVDGMNMYAFVGNNPTSRVDPMGREETEEDTAPDAVPSPTPAPTPTPVPEESGAADPPADVLPQPMPAPTPEPSPDGSWSILEGSVMLDGRDGLDDGAIESTQWQLELLFLGMAKGIGALGGALAPEAAAVEQRVLGPASYWQPLDELSVIPGRAGGARPASKWLGYRGPANAAQLGADGRRVFVYGSDGKVLQEIRPHNVKVRGFTQDPKGVVRDFRAPSDYKMPLTSSQRELLEQLGIEPK